ncbi:MAG: translocation/assembly module TamB domain-containing protein [Candidatus Omnitrophica bacterium]|nr:translocation/assembly module TamB domain-containing protein [Candidatus Omnitrophota bacterium]
MRTKIIITILIISVFISLVTYFSLFTTAGSRAIVTTLISKYTDAKNITFENVTGTIAQGVTFKNIEIKSVKELSNETILKIQKLFIKLKDFNYRNIFVEIENARLKLPASEPIIITGNLREQMLDVNIYSNGFTVNEIVSYLPDLKKLIPIKGEVTGVDLYIKDHYFEPRVVGDFKISKFHYKGFTLTECPARVDIELKEIQNDARSFGYVNIRDGNLQSQKSIIKQMKGSINFSGHWNQISFNLSGKAKIEKVNIEIGLKGYLDKPELSLSSEPSFSRQKLMVMLATGKSWRSVENVMDAGIISSSEMTKDFIDYYFFAGKKNKFAELLGIHDVSVKFDKDTKGIEAKKGVTDKLDIGYGIEQQSNGQQEKTTKQKIQGECNLTNTLSVGVEKGVKKTQSLDNLDPARDTVEDDEVYFKYKKSF